MVHGDGMGTVFELPPISSAGALRSWRLLHRVSVLVPAPAPSTDRPSTVAVADGLVLWSDDGVGGAGTSGGACAARVLARPLTFEVDPSSAGSGAKSEGLSETSDDDDDDDNDDVRSGGGPRANSASSVAAAVTSTTVVVGCVTTALRARRIAAGPLHAVRSRLAFTVFVPEASGGGGGDGGEDDEGCRNDEDTVDHNDGGDADGDDDNHGTVGASEKRAGSAVCGSTGAPRTPGTSELRPTEHESSSRKRSSGGSGIGGAGAVSPSQGRASAASVAAKRREAVAAAALAASILAGDGRGGGGGRGSIRRIVRGQQAGQQARQLLWVHAGSTEGPPWAAVAKTAWHLAEVEEGQPQSGIVDTGGGGDGGGCGTDPAAPIAAWPAARIAATAALAAIRQPGDPTGHAGAALAVVIVTPSTAVATAVGDSAARPSGRDPSGAAAALPAVVLFAVSALAGELVALEWPVERPVERPESCHGDGGEHGNRPGGNPAGSPGGLAGGAPPLAGAAPRRPRIVAFGVGRRGPGVGLASKAVSELDWTAAAAAEAAEAAPASSPANAQRSPGQALPRSRLPVDWCVVRDAALVLTAWPAEEAVPAGWVPTEVAEGAGRTGSGVVVRHACEVYELRTGRLAGTFPVPAAPALAPAAPGAAQPPQRWSPLLLPPPRFWATSGPPVCAGFTASGVAARLRLPSLTAASAAAVAAIGDRGVLGAAAKALAPPLGAAAAAMAAAADAQLRGRDPVADVAALWAARGHGSGHGSGHGGGRPMPLAPAAAAALLAGSGPLHRGRASASGGTGTDTGSRGGRAEDGLGFGAGLPAASLRHRMRRAGWTLPGDASPLGASTSDAGGANRRRGDDNDSDRRLRAWADALSPEGPLGGTAAHSEAGLACRAALHGSPAWRRLFRCGQDLAAGPAWSLWDDALPFLEARRRGEKRAATGASNGSGGSGRAAGGGVAGGGCGAGSDGGGSTNGLGYPDVLLACRAGSGGEALGVLARLLFARRPSLLPTLVEALDSGPAPTLPSFAARVLAALPPRDDDSDSDDGGSCIDSDGWNFESGDKGEEGSTLPRNSARAEARESIRAEARAAVMRSDGNARARVSQASASCDFD